MKMQLNLTYEEGKKVIDTVYELVEKNYPDEDIDSIANEYTEVIDTILALLGIEVNIAKEEEEEEEDNVKYALTEKGKFVYEYMDMTNVSFEEAMAIADILFENENEGE